MGAKYKESKPTAVSIDKKGSNSTDIRRTRREGKPLPFVVFCYHYARLQCQKRAADVGQDGDIWTLGYASRSKRKSLRVFLCRAQVDGT